MKKTIKYFTAITLMLILLNALTGCRYIEKMRQAQARFTKEDHVEWNGEIYRKLPICEFLSPKFGANPKMIYVAPEDTPVLLTRFFGVEMEMSVDRMFLISSAFSELEATAYYCHEDVYDSVMATIEKGYEPNGYILSYYDWYSEKDKQYTFTDEEAAAVDMVFSQTPAYGVSPEVWERYDVASTMKGQPFSRYELEIWVAEDGIYLMKYSEINGNQICYQVPNELEAVFQNVLDACA